MADEFKTYGIEYNCDGSSWIMHVTARSERDAVARLHRAANYGKVIGELKATIPAGGGWLARLICWWKNRRSQSEAKDG